MISVNVQLGDIEHKIKQATEFAQYALDQQVIKDCNYYIPMDTGSLERSALQSSQAGQIVWDTPYAEKLYYNPQYNFSKDKNPHARGLWFEEAKSVHGSEWVNVAEKAVKEHLG